MSSLGVWLLYQLVTGVGIGLGLPTLIGATASGLPAGRFATGMARVPAVPTARTSAG